MWGFKGSGGIPSSQLGEKTYTAVTVSWDMKLEVSFPALYGFSLLQYNEDTVIEEMNVSPRQMGVGVKVSIRKGWDERG